MKAGILGGGQLGRMLLQAAANYDVETFVLENDDHCPAAHLCHHFIKGDIKNFDDVYAFGKMVDVLTIEIENVNIEALEKLESEGKKIYPSTHALKIIKNKIKQKEFYRHHSIPSGDFIITGSVEEVKNNLIFLPAVHKLAEGGYDGRGVALLTHENLYEAFDKPSVLEKKVNIKNEISVIIAISNDGSHAVYPETEMFVDVQLNMLDYQLSPSQLPENITERAKDIALKTIKAFNSAGLFAVEMFVDENNEILVNETAPRVHNSGHHTIEGSFCSQFDMLWRIMLDYPLGNTDAKMLSAMINLNGKENFSGYARYNNIQTALAIKGCYVHIYGKAITKPGRKMGHITVLNNDLNALLTSIQTIKHSISVTA